ncbi:hypothetical protein A2480_01535 [Candidatus Uhrbacteria bacterium RIFOXYC2_FULL_47_19]|uniref:Uncharacterized protein n=1 Tax=Candidatus Uhrbacteria bacterium RIFOXYC2_FULL_47_19 TaxID=1802424 RepID=A0A1F7WGQ1_9BACT|nr:MAG: hypothetical protein A2480_01535 [Candidatus Uhrbacteria bacterium RIFOXYC2_FULL_47_19]HCC22470.1 hypothetical protein [Candidatus Uhrbacteria bacterium]
MSLPLAIILIPYGVIVLVFAIVALLNVYHLIHYSATSKTSFAFTFIFLAGTAVIAFLTWQAVGGVDWQTPISISLSSSSPELLPY